MKIVLILLVPFLALLVPLRAATVTTQEITQAEFEDLAMNNAMALEVRWVAFVGTFPEITLSNSSMTLGANHSWAKPEPVSLYIDMLANVDLDVGSTHMDLFVLDPFNTVIFQIQDGNTGTTEFTNFMIDGVMIRDLFADDPTENDFAYDHIRVDGVSQDTFSLSGNWSMGDLANGTDSYMRMYFFQSGPVGPSGIPEVSSLVLFCLASPLLLLRRRS